MEAVRQQLGQLENAVLLGTVPDSRLDAVNEKIVLLKQELQELRANPGIDTLSTTLQDLPIASNDLFGCVLGYDSVRVGGNLFGVDASTKYFCSSCLVVVYRILYQSTNIL